MSKKYKRTPATVDFKMPPTLHIPLEKLKEAEDWKPGEEYDLALHVKLTHLSETDASFEVLKAETDEEEDSDEDEEDDEDDD